jgi:hypothetical protein
MSRHFFFVCIAALIAILEWCSPRVKAGTDAPSAAATPTTLIGAIRARADQIELDRRRDGTWFVKLSGNATVNSGDMQASCENVLLSFSTKSKTVLHLAGKVSVRTDSICATARSAKIDFASALLELKSGDGHPAAIRTVDGDNDTRIEAASIRFNALKNSIEASQSTPIKVPPKPD